MFDSAFKKFAWGMAIFGAVLVWGNAMSPGVRATPEPARPVQQVYQQPAKTVTPRYTPPVVRTAPAQRPAVQQADPTAYTVYITNTGSKYHRTGCRYLSKSKIAIDFANAQRNYEPCKVCRP